MHQKNPNAQHNSEAKAKAKAKAKGIGINEGRGVDVYQSRNQCEKTETSAIS
jgi:hypothetical protein